MKERYALVFSALLIGACTKAQYCSPTFDFGCFSWNAQSILAGTIDWTPGADDCSVSDYTSLSTTVNAGEDLGITVVNGNWCGCAVWVDLDNSASFEDSENLYYIYTGGSPSYTYDFSVSIPSGTPTGSYRMRIISPWGSDGFSSSSTNGFGPCGAYQYGSFNDFTLNVVGSNGVGEVATRTAVSLSPNPASDVVTITSGTAMEQVTVLDAQGRVVEQHRVTRDRTTLQTDAWMSGVYLVQVRTREGITSQRLLVD